MALLAAERLPVVDQPYGLGFPYENALEEAEMMTPKSLLSLDGRISRSTYWRILVPILLIQIGIGFFGRLFLARYPDLRAVLELGLLLPLLSCLAATTTKRWHDLDKTGWFTLALLIPLVNVLMILYLGVARSGTGSNSYGEDPHQEGP